VIGANLRRVSGHDQIMQPNAFDRLIGLRLLTVRRAADMLDLHFGTSWPHTSGKGTVPLRALQSRHPRPRTGIAYLKGAALNTQTNCTD
jgi:hypothetical protein